MEEAQWQQQRDHYNQHAGLYMSKNEALLHRSRSSSFPIRKFHNQIKRYLIEKYAKDRDSLLDLACGRGGDLQKWKDSNIKFVKGLDISEKEIEEARQRYTSMKDCTMEVEFVVNEIIGMNQWKDECKVYDTVSCMFAMQYFFITERALDTFLHNVSSNLKEGGYFIGTVPDGKRVLQLLNNNDHFISHSLNLTRCWEGPPRTFGSAYQCDILDTVTTGNGGVIEYLCFFTALTILAAKYHMYPVTDFWCEYFEPQDIDLPFKHFNSSRLHPDLRIVSSMFTAFVFVKRM